ncbi:Gfo/Idh/MocA family oxidoreductase [Paenibacillus sp. 19GGS1-52]|uniref:Gfo/Idh/MocA family protein n=1 Tax=Paenibacillus sp. 19GGS1-52 TaxID=2758563 RepID=UPI001EFA6953|nr:Gfo/Idh/MocA family oxidoreductase [Paenibacillus sp. 19GGS1-52]ULO10074.1 Gfo/Idh/MocA family oxidoreductase [Paenibacillus sp. 19GGS1-52]
MNIGVLGTGFGAYHVELLSKMKHIGRIVVFGRNEVKLQKLQEELKVEVTTDIADILFDADIDVIDICLPTPLHKHYAIEALKNGKHVFCETPVCYEMADALEMQQAAAQYGRRIFINQFIKFDPAYRYLYESVHQQKYGKLLSFSLTRETSPMWGDLGLDSITTNLMIHDLDFLTWLLGAADKFTVWGTNAGKDGEALVRVFFEQSDVSAEILVSSQMPETYPFTVGYEAFFEHAKLIFRESDDIKGVIESTLYEYTSSGREVLILEKANPYEQSIEYALQCLHEGSESLLSLNNAIEALEIAIEIKNRLAWGNVLLHPY